MAARRRIAGFSFFSVIMAFLLFYCIGYAQEKNREKAPATCDRIVRNAKFIPIKFLSKTMVEDFALFPDGKEAIFLLLQWHKYLYQSKDDYVMVEFFPRYRPGDHVSLKEGEKIASSWKEEAKTHPGLKVDDTGGAGHPINIHAEQTQFYLYNVPERKWRALPRKEGERLFKEWNKEPYNQFHQQNQLTSPDATMVLCKKGRKQKKVSALFGVLEGTAAAFEIDVRCSQGTSGRILNLPYDCFFRWKAQWSDKNDFALICDMTQQQNIGQRCYILQLNKNKEEE